MSHPLPNFTLQKTIGKGTFGKVKQVRHHSTNQYAAVKLLQKDRICTKKDSLRVQRQMTILQQLHHPNILQLYQLQQTPKHYYIITELLEGEELFQKINRLGKLDEQQAALYFMQLLDAAIYLRKQCICHRDIKPENIIVKNDTLKLIDFGLSNYCRKGEWLTTSCGSPCYAAPQMMSEKRYDSEKTEVWALGVTLYAMLTGRLPFQHDNTQKLYKIMANNRYQEVPHISSSLQSLIRSMIEVNPQKRYGLKEITEHAWVKSQMYEFYETTERVWNGSILNELCNMYRKSQQEIKQIIMNFGPESSHYYLMQKEWSQSSQQQQFPLHTGPIHINFVFYSLEAIKQEIHQLYPQVHWIDCHTAQDDQNRIVIKQLACSPIFYLHLQPLP